MALIKKSISIISRPTGRPTRSKKYSSTFLLLAVFNYTVTEIDSEH